MAVSYFSLIFVSCSVCFSYFHILHTPRPLLLSHLLYVFPRCYTNTQTGYGLVEASLEIRKLKGRIKTQDKEVNRLTMEINARERQLQRW